jgi:hypothetical protein
MIFTLIIIGMMALVTLIFSVMPTVPAMPQGIIDPIQTIFDVITQALSVIRYLYGSAFYDVLIIALIALFVFEYGYYTILWILKKIPVINIK